MCSTLQPTPAEMASELAARTHVDHRLFKLDVQPVVGRGDDGIFCSPHILGELPVQLGEGNLATAADKAMQTGCGATQGSGGEDDLWPEGWEPIRLFTKKRSPAFYNSKDHKIFTIHLRVEGLG